MELYFGINSGNSSRSLFCLEEAGADYQARLVDPKAGENRTAEYLGYNPMGKIPALADGDVRLWESNAINWYVAETHAQAHLLPHSIIGRASVQRWLYFQTGHVSPACVPIFRADNERVKAYWGPGDPAAAVGPRKDLARWLAVLEERLDGRRWLEGEFTLADLAYVPHLWLVEEAGYDFSPFPRVVEWLHRMYERPAWQRVRALVFR